MRSSNRLPADDLDAEQITPSLLAAGLAAAALRLAYLPNRFGDATRPRVAMPGKHLVRGDRFQTGQRFDRLGGVRGERRHLRATGPGRHRVGGKRVTDEQRAKRGEIQRGAARGVAGESK